jgi:hypothetical protein
MSSTNLGALKCGQLAIKDNRVTIVIMSKVKFHVSVVMLGVALVVVVLSVVLLPAGVAGGNGVSTVKGSTSECMGVLKFPPAPMPKYKITLWRGGVVVDQSKTIQGHGSYRFVVKPGNYILRSSGNDSKTNVHIRLKAGHTIVVNLPSMVCPL